MADAAAACATSSLNAFFELGPASWQALRHALFELRHIRNATTNSKLFETCLVPQSVIEHAVPVRIGDYTDYYTSL